jgi:hypothetical protein
MIFPDLPIRHTFNIQPIVQSAPVIVEAQTEVNTTTKAEEWFEKHFPDQSTSSIIKPAKTPSFAEDPRGWIEFILLIVFIIGWATFWKLQQ